jgi:arginase
LLGVPTSSASLAAGPERGPAAWRAAGLADRLQEAGFAVTDQGDCAERTFTPDDEHPRARNVGQVVATLEELRPKVEVAVKSGALPLVLGGDDSIVLATIAGCRRYFRHVGLIYFDRDAGLNEPASTPSGCVDGMVISHVLGRGAPEMVRFWGEPPLVREPEIALLGITRVDEPEQRFLSRSLLRRYLADDISRKGAAATAREALERVHGLQSEFVLHIDLDVIAAEDFPATNLSEPGGMRWQEMEEMLAVLAPQPKLAALVISAYNPARDPEGAAARRFIDLLAKTLAPRMAPPAEAAEASEAAAAAPAETPTTPSEESAQSTVAAEASEAAAAAPAETPTTPSEEGAQSTVAADPSEPAEDSQSDTATN